MSTRKGIAKRPRRAPKPKSWFEQLADSATKGAKRMLEDPAELRAALDAGTSFATAVADAIRTAQAARAGAAVPPPPRPRSELEDAARELGITLPTTREVLDQAFKRRAFVTHPDRPGGSQEAFVRTKAAHTRLSSQVTS